MGRKRVCSLKNIMIGVYVGVILLKSFMPFKIISELKTMCVFTTTNQTDSSSLSSGQYKENLIFMQPNLENICDGRLDPLLETNPIPVPDFTKDLINFLEEFGNSKTQHNSKLSFKSETFSNLQSVSNNIDLKSNDQTIINGSLMNLNSNTSIFNNFISRLILFFFFQLGGTTFSILMFNSNKTKKTEMMIVSTIALLLTYGTGCIIGTLFDVIISPLILSIFNVVFTLLLSLCFILIGCLYYFNKSDDDNELTDYYESNSNASLNFIEDSFYTKMKQYQNKISLMNYMEYIQDGVSTLQSKTLLIGLFVISISLNRCTISVVAYSASVDQINTILESFIATICSNLLAIYLGCILSSFSRG